ncbi:ABC transporter ATP-binding protein [Altibacter sp.]|uniref:ABC transporter ATP-binding protein n=1 Tax=Altibacter sp. TaxID=2024823 RepID=UPI000C8DDBE1|nr:ABC transporter ATP-binding protein [Altibacter sp.]MAP54128.1 ABC transporter ATP-binding protein [Altibacter sp.]|tara:strand:- start:481 stop:1272 length:792 start_codon:yes stop_codon:yes gene_type:complete
MASEERHTILDVNALAIGYSHKSDTNKIAEGISFSLKQGSLVGLVGANGIGKSTLLRTLSGMQSPLDGSVLLQGKSFKSYSALGLAAQLSVVLTEAPASKNLTVQELISLGRQPYTNWMGRLSEIDIQVINEAMEATDTFPLAQRKCFELSDGQLQRVYIARALAQDTPLILLDEPTTHLDLYHRAYVLQLLKRLTTEKNKCILFSTHEIDLAIQLSDLMVVMSKEGTYVDQPCNLISAGRFDTLFPKDVIRFDPDTGRFGSI